MPEQSTKERVCAQCGKRLGKDAVTKAEKEYCCSICCQDSTASEAAPNVCRFC